MAVKARAASRALQALTSADRVAILHRIADSLEAHEAEVGSRGQRARRRL